ncbi:uncharacterized protein LOC132754935, partial [Ruditapes philippinarum]|uniref:uncharacterized protein LOC132754935 n=1 Tax=Ruditapes philippinarum TaxID=129788 RepID=UPI00295B560A
MKINKLKKKSLINKELPISNTCNEDNLESKSESSYIMLTQESHTDMEILLHKILEDDSAGDFKILLESQVRNIKNSIDARQRRWDPTIIRVCLGILIRSPSAYNHLKESGLLVLPSRRTLQYYKNSFKQKPGFNNDNLEWMQNEAVRTKVSEFGMHGGILLDEMAIQDDLIICKNGDSWDIVGMMNMGETNNNIKIISDGKKKIQMATHILQFVFHGFTGFRWPVVYFASCTAKAHELYTTFWECVDKLDEFGFTVDYVMLDGASTNRAFLNMLMVNAKESKFLFQNIYFHKHYLCAIQDIMHVLKKVRNNIESSIAENKTKPGRYLIMNETPILWDHWREAFNQFFKL